MTLMCILLEILTGMFEIPLLFTFPWGGNMFYIIGIPFVIYWAYAGNYILFEEKSPTVKAIYLLALGVAPIIAPLFIYIVYRKEIFSVKKDPPPSNAQSNDL